jgi:hypothetical protein
MNMTTDERAAACAGEIDDTLGDPIDWENVEQVIACHIRESVSERDEILLECAMVLSDNNIYPSLVERIDAIIGGAR